MDRIHSLDVLKGIALFFVVIVHAKPYRGMEFFDGLSFVLVNTARFAVPVFFLISGYLLSLKLKNSSGRKYVSRYLGRLFYMYVGATLVFLALNLILANLSELISPEVINEVIKLDIKGLSGFFSLIYLGDAVSYHLWFLPALMISIAIVYLFSKIDRIQFLVFGAGLLHVIGILSNAYSIIGFSVPRVDAVFFGLFFTVTGFYLEGSDLKNRITDRSKLYLFLMFVLLHLVERALISIYFPAARSFYIIDYSFFTAPMAVVIFLYAISNPDFLKTSRLKLYGGNSFWGYVLHPVVLAILMGMAMLIGKFSSLQLSETLVWQTAIVPLTYFLTMEGAIRFKS